MEESILCDHGLEDNIVLSVFLQLTYTFYPFPIKMCVKIDKLTVKFIWKFRVPRIIKTILKIRSSVGGLTLFQT